jgi:DNA (cytosine-5)-methyltransferase 1
MEKFNFIDLCSGIGGFRFAFEKYGGKCVLSSEIDCKTACIYQNIFSESIQADEIFIDNVFSIPKKINLNNMNVDILSAGFPCQPFSSAGSKRGFEDERGNIFFGICDIISKLKPKVIILENVKNIINHDKGRTLSIILTSLKDLGYNVNYSIINTKDFGIPQNRERFYLVGSLKKDFSFSNMLNTKNTKKLKGFISKTEYIFEDTYSIIPRDLWKKQKKSDLIFCGYFNKNLRKVEQGKKIDVNYSRYHRQCNRIYHVNGTTPTISAQESSGRYYVYDDQGVFQISSEDITKLQGFPDWVYKYFENKSMLYRCLGNAVSPPVIEAVMESILQQKLL